MRSRRDVIRKLRPHLERLEDRTVPAVFTVNSTLDLPDANPGDGLAEAFDTVTGQWVTTLRAAVMEANALPGHDTIYLPAGTYVLTLKGPDEDGGANGDLDILDHLDLIGDGADVTAVQVNVDLLGFDRVLDVHLQKPGQTLLSGFTVTGGRLASGDGGGIRILIQDPEANLTLDGLHVTNNSSPGYGGGIYIRTVNDGVNFGIENSTVSDNIASFGGGIAIDQGYISIQNSTISSNLAEWVGSGTGLGGGIFNSRGIVYLVHATVVWNGATAGGGLYTSATDKQPGTYIVCNSIIAANNLKIPPSDVAQPGHPTEGPDLYGFTFVSFGGNLIGDSSASAGFVDGVNFDIVGGGKFGVIDPKLGPLAYNGGATPTHLPLAGSPAINNAYGKASFPRDQRGFDRPFGPMPDIGAVELQEDPVVDTDLIVDITTPNGLVRPGKKLTYTIVVSNAGPSVAENVQLALLLPENANYLGFTTTTGFLTFHSGRDMLFDLGTLAVGEQATITVSVRMRRVGLAALEAVGTTRSNDIFLPNNRDAAYHFAGRPLYIDDRLLTLLLGRPNGHSWDQANGNGNGHGGGTWIL